MSHTLRTLGALTALAFTASSTAAQSSADMPPVNDLPNPYRTVENWAKLPEGRTWGSTSAVDVAPDGKHIWVAERCSVNHCVGSNLDPIMLFDTNGNVVRSFGAGLIQSPHGIHVDRENNVWVTDCSCTVRGAPPPAAGTAPRGHQIFKFSPDGKLLLTIGKPAGGKNADYFWQPNDIVTAPNGDIFVAEGHSSADTANARILKFDRTGKLLMSWGKRGSGATDMDQPHALALDSRGRLYVGDRGNDRILIFDQNGKHLDTWYQFSRPSGIWIDAQDNIYVADSESGSVDRTRTTWKRGIRIGSARDGKVTAFIPDPAEAPRSTSSAEGVAVDAAGNIYGAEVDPRSLKKYVRR